MSTSHTQDVNIQYDIYLEFVRLNPTFQIFSPLHLPAQLATFEMETVRLR